MLTEKEVKKINNFFPENHIFRLAKIAWICKCFTKNKLVDEQNNTLSKNFDTDTGLYYCFEVFFIVEDSVKSFILMIDLTGDNEISKISDCILRSKVKDMDFCRVKKEVFYCDDTEKDRMREYLISIL